MVVKSLTPARAHRDPLKRHHHPVTLKMHCDRASACNRPMSNPRPRSIGWAADGGAEWRRVRLGSRVVAGSAARTPELFAHQRQIFAQRYVHLRFDLHEIDCVSTLRMPPQFIECVVLCDALMRATVTHRKHAVAFWRRGMIGHCSSSLSMVPRSRRHMVETARRRQTRLPKSSQDVPRDQGGMLRARELPPPIRPDRPLAKRLWQ